MSDDKAREVEVPRVHGGGGRARRWPWIELLKVLALPLVTLVLGYWFNASLNERQQAESNVRLYAEMMGRREEADSTLRKDMFNSILTQFLSRDPGTRISSEEAIRQQILSLELLAYNFHESLDIGPLFKDVQRRITLDERATNVELRARLETVATQVIEQQLTTLSDVGSVERGFTEPAKIATNEAHLDFGTKALVGRGVAPGAGTSLLCLSMQAADGTRHYRQFTIEPWGYDEATREIQVRFYVSKLLEEPDCRQAPMDLDAQKEVDTNFRVGLFDFPMIDTTRLAGGERATVSVVALNPSVLNVALSYFPASRASLKDKPYYDEVIEQLVRNRQASRNREEEPPAEP